MGHRLERREWEGSFADIAACIFQQVTQERNTGAEARSRFRAVRQTDSYFILQTVVVISDFERLKHRRLLRSILEVPCSIHGPGIFSPLLKSEMAKIRTMHIARNF